MSVFSSFIQPKIFWVTIVIVSVIFLLTVFSQNYALDQETKTIFADVAQGVIRPEKSVIDTSLWKVYENKKFGFSFKYPSELQAFPCAGVMLFCLNIGEKNLAFQENGFAIRIYDVAKLNSRDENGFMTREINGNSWRFKIDDTQAFRTDVAQDKEFRVFANLQYVLLGGVVSTFQLNK